MGQDRGDVCPSGGTARQRAGRGSKLDRQGRGVGHCQLYGCNPISLSGPHPAGPTKGLGSRCEATGQVTDTEPWGWVEAWGPQW